MSGERRRLLRRMAKHQRPEAEPRLNGRTRLSGVVRRRMTKRARAANVARYLCADGILRCDRYPSCQHQGAGS